MKELLEKIVRKIENLSDPADLGIVLEKLKDYPSLGIDEMMEKLVVEFLQSQPDRKGTYIMHVRVKSRHTCDNCDEYINNGFFKILVSSLSELNAIEISKQAIISYDDFHQMKVHGTFNETSSAMNADISELMQENDKKNPRDQMSQMELAKTIQPYTLANLDILLS